MPTIKKSRMIMPFLLVLLTRGVVTKKVYKPPPPVGKLRCFDGDGLFFTSSYLFWELPNNKI